MLIKVIYESIVQAIQQLNSNKLRSFLSSLGITIGIFCIVSVLSAVDSLEQNINQSFEKLGSDVLYVDKQPWNENPDQSWWKYAQRPNPDHDDLQALKERVSGSEHASLSIFIPGKTVKYKSSYVQGAYMAGITYDYADIINLEYSAGRYFTPYEYSTGANKVILGAKLIEELFGDDDPIGKEVTIMGRKFSIIGAFAKEGNSLVSVFQPDESIVISYNTAKKLINVKSGSTWGTLLNIKAKPGVELVDLRDEVTGVLRAHRKLRPKEDNNFALNELSTITNAIEGVFSVMSIVGAIIGGFAILVGVISVANIMFVSVRERTNIIGIKKALGARRSVILFEFLVESILLCLVGGAIGVGLVALVLELLSNIAAFQMFVSVSNIVIAIVGTVAIGVVAGIIPAVLAARMDPVDAIRHRG